MAEAPDRRIDVWRDGMRNAVLSLGTIGPPGAPRWPVALQATVVLVTPLLVGALAGRFELGLLASVGAFTVPYFSRLPRLERLRLRPIAGLVIVLSAVLGATLGPEPALGALGLIAVAAGVGIAVHGYRLGPPGPLFPIIVYGMSSHAVTGGVPPTTLVACVGGGCLFAVIVSIAPLVRRVHWTVTPRPLKVLLAPPEWDRGARELAVRTAIVAVAGTLLSVLWVDPDRAYWTVAAGAVVVGVMPGRGLAVNRGLHRTVGTIAGAGLYLLLSLLPMNPPLVALVLGSLQFITEIIITRHYALAVTAVTPLALILVTTSIGEFGTPAVVGERIVDTLVGAGIAVLTALVHPRAPRE
ncbi:FUSC family protein [Demequina pelophila]|uniref:FUSC family protein n=1 Tax=Demequina pelophila TaxID=1638984 RepID=UPI000783DB1D|nr:FUSC family protein [Demequina pelophila]